MSRLGDFENIIVSRLAAAMLQGAPLFAKVRGVSGGHRAQIRDALRRERMPAAYVAFTDEPTAPETRAAVLGERFVVLVADRVLRAEADPRLGDVDSPGAFVLLEQARLQLDDYEPQAGTRIVNLHQKFIEADDRVAVYELLYRFWPIVQTQPLRFGGTSIAGSDSRMALEVGPIEIEAAEFRFPGLDGTYRHVQGARSRRIIWRGQVRGVDDSAVDSTESAIEAAALNQSLGDVDAGATQVFADCVLDQYVRHGPRRLDRDGRTVVQDAELLFSQLNPA